jgi:hypothetical protein
MLVKGALTVEEALPFKLSSIEKGVSKALLGIRGVKRVVIEGRGMMEGCFAETSKATLVQPPCTGIIKVQDPALSAFTYRLNREDEITSKGYGRKAL